MKWTWNSGWRHSSAALRWALMLALSAVGTVAAISQDQQPVSTFGDVITVRVINLEVVVTDRKGERVTGLKPEDFRLRVDQRDTPIEFFSEILEGEEQEGEERLPAAPGVVDGRASVSYLVFVDDFFSIARDRNRALDSLEEDLVHLRAGDRMAIVAYDGRSLKELTGWTSSRAVLRNALEEARDRKSLGLHRLVELRSNDSQRSRALQRNFASRLATQVERSVEAAAATMRSSASTLGRKVLILLSGGWPAAPHMYARGSGVPDIGSLDTATRSYGGLLGSLSDTANLLGYTVYSVDVPGLQTGAGSDASATTSTALAGNSQRDREDNLHASLDFLAHETGGKSLLNARGRNALEAAAEDTRSYYWLGFTVSRRADGEQHDIQVDVLRPGLKARSRQGFLDMSQEAEIQMTVEGLLLFGNPPNSLPLELRFGKAERERRGILRVPLAIGFSLDDIQLVPIAGRQVAEVQVVITVMDAQGNRSETPVQKVSISGGNPEPGQLFWWRTDLLLRNRKHRVTVAVYDPLSKNILSSDAEISP